MSQIEKFSIKNWSVDDRPREKLSAQGRTVLSNAELLAILIGSGNRNESAVELSKRILKNVDNNLNELGKLDKNDLRRFRGIGDAKAISIIAALELGRRRKEEGTKAKKKIASSKGAYEVLRTKLEDLPHEEFWVLLLNRSNMPIGLKLVGRGGVSGTVADVKIIFKLGVEGLASGIILGHNHPSGNLNPSEADLALTKKIKEAGKIMDIPVLDHIIVGDNEYYSFADNGIL